MRKQSAKQKKLHAMEARNSKALRREYVSALQEIRQEIRATQAGEYYIGRASDMLIYQNAEILDSIEKVLPEVEA